jgi:hypothetical protein
MTNWRPRLFDSNTSATIAQRVHPFLLAPANSSMRVGTRDFLTVIWSTNLDRVLLTCVELLHVKAGVNNFEEMRRALERWCRPAVWPAWDAYLRWVLREARDPSRFAELGLPADLNTFRKAKGARDLLVAHVGSAAWQDRKRHQIKMSSIIYLQSVANRIFREFPEGSSMGLHSAWATHFSDLIARVVAGDAVAGP